MVDKTVHLELPRKDKEGNSYISYSQLNSWKRSKRDYIRSYFYGEKFDGNAYTEMGSLVGEALENNNFSAFNEKEQKFLAKVPRLDEFEREIKLEMSGFYVKGFIDTNDSMLTHLIDYKTGDVKKKKAEYESDDYTQLDIYAAAIKQETGKLPRKAHVILIDRTGNAFKGEDLVLGSQFVTIKKKITNARVKKVMDDIQETAREISEYYRVFKLLNK